MQSNRIVPYVTKNTRLNHSVCLTMLLLIITVAGLLVSNVYSTIVSVAEPAIPDSNSSKTTLFHSKCCNSSNTGKSFLIDQGSTMLSVIMCPTTVPTSCPAKTYASCEEALNDNAMQDGYHNIKYSEDGEGSRSLYCVFKSICGGTDEVWIGAGFLNMSDSEGKVVCPFGFQFHDGDIKTCGRANTSMGSCASIGFPLDGVSYTEICGRVKGFQYGSPDAIDSFHEPLSHNDINTYYVDGVSITRGNNPRTHVWTYMAGLLENVNNEILMYGDWPFCPCFNGSTKVTQTFVGNDYYCESGIPGQGWQLKAYLSDPLWDGRDCNGDEEECCEAASMMPWFHHTLATPSADTIELRLCCDQGTDNEDILIEEWEVYVK